MRLTKEYLQSLKANIDIVKYVSKYTELKKNGNVYVGKCPHPLHNDTTPSFRVWSDSQSWACMGCHSGEKGGKNYGSDIISFISWIDNLSFIDSVKKLSQITGIPLPKTEYDYIYKRNYDLAMKYYMNVPVIEKYLNIRGVNRDSVRKFKIGFDGKRIYFPLINVYNQYVGFISRQYADKNSVKYINSPNSKHFQKNQFLYNAQNLDKNIKEVRITEGPFDVIVASQRGAKNVVATLGTALTDNHIDFIKDHGYTPVMCFDGDDKGFENAIKASEKFAKEGIFSKILILNNGFDLAETAMAEGENIEDYISTNALSYNQFKINKIMNIYNAKVNEIKIKLLPQIENVIRGIKNPEEKKIISDTVKNNMNLNV